MVLSMHTSSLEEGRLGNSDVWAGRLQQQGSRTSGPRDFDAASARMRSVYLQRLAQRHTWDV
eukprot:scaffold210173_cov36-Tisochrysis_lutea.AAC.3